MKVLSVEKIAIVGNGNLASGLVDILIKRKLIPTIVIGHRATKSKAFGIKHRVTTSINMKDIPGETTVIFLCVPDDQIETVARTLKNHTALVVHCSGSTPLLSIKKQLKNCGVFYPLQTFSSEIEVEIKKTPILIEANTVANENKLETFARQLSERVHRINSEERAKIHLAAVLSCNFTNHLYSLTDAYLKNNSKLSFDLLKPLIKQTVKKLKYTSAEKSQTGPAIRGDKKTIEKHITMLAKDKNLQDIYKLLSASIARKK